GPYRAWRHDVVGALRRNRNALVPVLAARGFVLSPTDSGPYALAAAPRAAQPPLDALDIARAHGVLLMDAVYCFHTAADWSGFRINLSGDHGTARRALDRALGPQEGS
ncbi:MAG: hypothetical protein ACHQ4H_11285, partial [Ktedonobacterales bacterium]